MAKGYRGGATWKFSLYMKGNDMAKGYHRKHRWKLVELVNKFEMLVGDQLKIGGG